jgi:hypothetical protein
MKMKTLSRISLIAALAIASAFAQTDTPRTTLCAAITSTTATSICLTSTTNVVKGTGIYVDLELMVVLTTPTGTTNAPVQVARGRNSAAAPAALHANAQTAWLALTPDKTVVPGANGFGEGTAFTDYGPCTRSSITYLPHIWPNRGEILDCDSTVGRWVPYQQIFTLAIGPGNCEWSTTGTYDVQVAVAVGGPNLQGALPLGASGVPVKQVKVTNAAPSINTLTCIIPINTYQPLINKGITVKYADVLYGVATTTLTSISGGAFSTITFPAPGATQTASTVTPVAVGGSVTTSSTTGNLAATTAGAFKVSRLTPATPINLTTDQQFLIVSETFNQSASAAQVVNTPGILLHYTVQAR